MKYSIRARRSGGGRMMVSNVLHAIVFSKEALYGVGAACVGAFVRGGRKQV